MQFSHTVCVNPNANLNSTNATNSHCQAVREFHVKFPTSRHRRIAYGMLNIVSADFCLQLLHIVPGPIEENIKSMHVQ